MPLIVESSDPTTSGGYKPNLKLFAARRANNLISKQEQEEEEEKEEKEA